MPVFLIAGPASPEVRNHYLSEISKSIENSVYLNIDSIISVFNKPLKSQFTDKYPYEERVIIPSHQFWLALALDNLSLHKTVILDGHFDFDLTEKLIEEEYPKIKESGIQVLYFNPPMGMFDIPLSLNQSFAKYPMLLVSNNGETRVESILRFLKKDVGHELNVIHKKMFVPCGGLAGVGKTTYMREVCEGISNSVYLDNDPATFQFLKRVHQPLPSQYYKEHVQTQRYDAVFKIADDNITFGKIPFADGCFGNKITCSWVKSFLAKDVIVVPFYFHCTHDTQLDRLKKRAAPRDAEKLKDPLPDRKKSLQEHLKQFALVENISFFDTEEKEKKRTTIAQILQILQSPDLKSMVISDRKNPLDSKICEISLEEAKGGLKEFQATLNRIRKQDALQQKITDESKQELVPNAFFAGQNIASNVLKLTPRNPLLSTKDEGAVKRVFTAK